MSSIGRRGGEIIMNLDARSCVLLDGWFRDLKFYIRGFEIKFIENYFFLENDVTSEGAVSHIVLYYQPLPTTRNHESVLIT